MKRSKKFLMALLSVLTVGAFSVAVSACESQDNGAKEEAGINSPVDTDSEHGDNVDEMKNSQGLQSSISSDESYYVVRGIGTCTDSELVIPSEYNGLPVKKIGQSAFEECSFLRKLIIPDSVTNIAAIAFLNCQSLMSVEIGTSVKSIGERAFANCFRLVEIYNKSMLEIKIGEHDNNGRIGYYAKAIYGEPYTSKLSKDKNGYVSYIDGTDKILLAYTGTETNLILPEDITELHRWAFYNYSFLTSVTIPDSVTKIGRDSFGDCDALISATFKNPNGWKQGERFVSSTDLADPSTAAERLKNMTWDWTRTDN